MMEFYDPKDKHSYLKKDLQVYGCFTRTEHSTDLFLKRNYNTLSHQQLCNYSDINNHQNHQILHSSQSTTCKISLKKSNMKTFIKTHQFYTHSQTLIPRRKTQDKLLLRQNGLVCVCDNKTPKNVEKKLNPDFPAGIQIYKGLQIVSKKVLQQQNHEFRLRLPQDVHQITSHKPKINIHIQSPKIGHQRCKSENHILQNNTQSFEIENDSPPKIFVSAIFQSNQNLQNKNISKISRINQKIQNNNTSKSSFQTILTSDCSKKSLIHLTQYKGAQDSVISNKSSAYLNNTAHSFHSFVSNSKKLKKVDQVLEVQSLGDENEVQSKCESVVLDRLDEQATLLQDEANGGQTWRATQRRLIKVSKLLKSQSVDIL